MGPTLERIQRTRPLRVAFVSAETEHCLVGGLAEVAKSLPKALQTRGVEVTRFCPLYGTVWNSTGDTLREKSLRIQANVRLEGDNIGAIAYEDTKAIVPTFYFKDIPIIPKGVSIHGKSLEEVFLQKQFNGGGISAQQVINAAFSRFFYRGRVYPEGADLGSRFLFATRAVLELIKTGEFGQFDVIHFQDWHFALIATLLKFDPSYRDMSNMAVVGTVHNPFSWRMPPERFEALSGLRRADIPNLYNAFDGLLHNFEIHFLKGIQHADILNTVSPTYARELLTPEMGLTFDGVFGHMMNTGRFSGILNGIDADWDPTIDKRIAQYYSPSDISGKAVCKEELRAKFGLASIPDAPIFGVVARMTAQKGFDILLPSVEHFVNQGAQFIFLGAAEDKKYITKLDTLQQQHPGMIAMVTGYNNTYPSLVYSGSDMFIRPSYYEPCGLSQMIGLKYGAVPIVHKTGGLADTVFDFDQAGNASNGFSFKPYGEGNLRERMQRAFDIYRGDKASWTAMMLRGMTGDYTWDVSVQQYLDLYDQALSISSARSA